MKFILLCFIAILFTTAQIKAQIIISSANYDEYSTAQFSGAQLTVGNGSQFQSAPGTVTASQTSTSTTSADLVSTTTSLSTTSSSSTDGFSFQGSGSISSTINTVDQATIIAVSQDSVIVYFTVESPTLFTASLSGSISQTGPNLGLSTAPNLRLALYQNVDSGKYISGLLSSGNGSYLNSFSYLMQPGAYFATAQLTSNEDNGNLASGPPTTAQTTGDFAYSFSATVAPEPSTASLLFGGIIAVCMLRYTVSKLPTKNRPSALDS